jgi:hypothetical protein
MAGTLVQRVEHAASALQITTFVPLSLALQTRSGWCVPLASSSFFFSPFLFHARVLFTY